LDVGKTLAKLTMWTRDGLLVERRMRRNAHRVESIYPCLDVDGITAWLKSTLRDFAQQANIVVIIPVGHGAAACIIDKDGLCLQPMDYEADPPSDIKVRYRSLRDPFDVTGSPSLPAGLNLGAQLFWLEAIAPERACRGQIVTWPQYWAWTLSGVAATEVTSLGCHTDLWLPREGRPAPLAVSRGWAGRLAPLCHAADVLGPVTEEWRDACGLPKECVVRCGLHDSNAALLAMCLYEEIGDREFTVLSTGTWFVAMRSTLDAKYISASLPEHRDCLVNVDVQGRPVPSSRFMGGREAENLEDGNPLDPSAHVNQLFEQAARMIEERVFALPAFQGGVGPYPENRGHWWKKRPGEQLERRAVAGLYLALMADVSLDLIGSSERLVIEGRFAGDPVFTRALAALRPRQTVFLSDMQDNVPLGALSLVDTGIAPQARLVRVEPIDIDLRAYADQWRATAENEKAP
jgi:sugar (pentulose or hexulose) kinase